MERVSFIGRTGFLFLFLLSMTVILVVDGYNLDTLSPVLASGTEDTYFGFSVALHRDGSENMMIVGAPLEDIGIVGASNTGAVYRCPVVPPYDRHANCTIIELDTEVGENVNKSDQWLGGTVRSSGDDGVVMSCAPFYKELYTKENGFVETTGSCFISRNNFSSSSSYQVCSPPDGFNQDYNGFYKGSTCQAGMSAAFNAEDDFILGGPGSYGHQGSIYVQTDDEDNFQQPVERKTTFDGSFQGYSVAQGRFSSVGDMNYVTGAPRAMHMRGKVFIYDSTMGQINRIAGDQTGSYFGHGVVAEDFNDDGLDDLVVSAPFYWNREQNKPNVGQICIFYQNAEHQLLHDTTTVITGKVLNGRFGFSITSLGDVNNDGVNDLAVAAPYDGEGAIFIYHGKRNGKINTVETQILRPESFGITGFNHFGYSISGGRDADDNEYPDLLVGDYTADKVLLVRTRPIIRPLFNLVFDREGVDINTADVAIGNRNYSGFNLTACIWYTGKGTPEQYNFSVELTIDTEKQTPRALFHVDDGATGARVVSFKAKTITKTRNWCETTTAVMEDKVIDKTNPIIVSIRATPLQDEDLPPGGIHPVVEENSRTAQNQIRIIADCINDDCSPDLVLDVASDMSTLYMGDTTRVTLTTTVRNEADEAFQARLHATVPESWKLAAYTPIRTVLAIICKQSETGHVQCDIGNPLPREPTELKFNMTFNVLSVPGDVGALTLVLHTNSTNTEGDSTSSDNRQALEITLEPKVNVSLKGSANLPQFVFNRTVIDVEGIENDYQAGEEIIHNYWVSNIGPGTIGNATLAVSWPMYTEDDVENDFLLYLTEVTLSTGETCDVSNRKHPGVGVNPRNLTITPFDPRVEDEDEERTGNRTDSPNRRERSVPDDNDMPSNYSHVEERPEPMAQTDIDDIQVANCSRGYGGCVQIKCRLRNIPKGEDVLLRIRSRLWSATLEENDVFSWDMVSFASVDIHEVPYSKQPTDGLYEEAMLTLSVLPEVLTQNQQAPLWAILLSVFIGLLILILVILILWKLGFFKRKKFDEDANLVPPEAQAPE